MLYNMLHKNAPVPLRLLKDLIKRAICNPSLTRAVRDAWGPSGSELPKEAMGEGQTPIR
jgi:hypothetical protein